ncbi:MAG: alcohol dehydrogenase catalytic domain-containing protein [Actinomycetota bacterium]|nr:alcohol dehydrogenase catalytic domain-containing protein [Actinomycetota bacterium]
MLALLATPGTADSTRVAETAPPSAALDPVLAQTLEVGVCGTDREISCGLFGVAPEHERDLVLGHEWLGVVERDSAGFSRGDLVTATVRRSCGRCAACAQGAPDACLTGDYRERGITRLHGYAAELVAEAPEHLVAVPATLGRLGVLAEPASVCARGIRHARAIGARQPWAPARALVLGTGAIGMLCTYFLRLEGLEVWTVGRAGAGTEKARLVASSGAEYVSAKDTSTAALAAELGGFDLVMEATGDARVMLATLGFLRRNGVACLLGIDGRPGTIRMEGRVLGVDAVLQNRALVGSVNANRVDWLAAVEQLDRAARRWPEALAAFVGLRTPPDRFADAFAFGGVKATLLFG